MVLAFESGARIRFVRRLKLTWVNQCRYQALAFCAAIVHDADPEFTEIKNSKVYPQLQGIPVWML